MTEANALKLFENVVGTASIQATVVKKEKPIERLILQYREKIQNHFIVDHTVTFQEIPNLLVPVRVHLVGRNGVDVFVQSIDMTSAQSQIINEISTFYLLKDTYKRNKSPFKDFVLSEEPPKELKKQYDIWKQLKDSKEFNYVDTSESGRIIEYAELNNVRPIFWLLDETDNFPF